MLTITVYEARGLAAADKNDVLNSYVKTYLLPDEGKSSKRKTSIKKKTLNPVYNETLTYELDDTSDVPNRTILLTVWDHDKLGRNHFLGGSHIPLFSLDLSDNAQKWYTLENNENVRRGSSASIDNETYKFIKSLPLEETELKLETQHQPLVIKESNSNNVVIEHTESSPSHPTLVMRDNNDDNGMI
jgi:synaptotagmin-like protein